jgi:ABC-2 type transport system permease protein
VRAFVRGVSALYLREMLSLWVTPLAWVLLSAFLLVQGGIFYSIVLHFSQMTELTLDTGPLEAYFGQHSVLLSMTLLLVCPALSMRTFAEEQRSGSIEALLTAPVSSSAIVLGKFFAVWSTYALIWAPTLLYALILRRTGTVDWPVVGTSYLGLFLVGASYLALGILMSALTKSQLVALMLTLCVQFGLFVLGVGEYVFEPGPVRDLCAHVSLSSQLEEMSKGIVDLRRVVFDASVALWALFVTSRVVESWRQG